MRVHWFVRGAVAALQKLGTVSPSSPMSTDAPDEIDPFVPVSLDCSCGEKAHFLIGSAHTHPGRMWAWCPSRQKHMMISKSEIVACSRESSYWIAGFLHGNAPSCPTAPDGGYLPADDARVQRWREAVQEFGVLP